MQHMWARLVRRLLEGLNAMVLVSLLGVVVVTVVCRTFLDVSVLWSEELAQFAFIFLVFIGSAALMKDDSHLRITSLTDLFGPRGRRTLRIVERLAMLVFFVPFIYGAYVNASANWHTGLDTANWMTIGYMYLVVCLSGLFMMACVLVHLYNDARGRYVPTALAVEV